MAEETAPSAAKQTSDPADKPPTAEDFVNKWPLYTPFEVDGNLNPPERISLHCGGKCGKETTWLRVGDSHYQSMEGVSEGFYWVHYTCGLCKYRYLVVFYRILERKPQAGRSPGSTTYVTSKIQKIGQAPALSVSIPRSLEKNLGEASASLYKKSLICRNEGYGLAAVTYIRRVVEDKTDELIEVVSQLAESHNVDSEVIKKIRAAKTERTSYDDKLKIAATVLPESLVIDGVNPLGELYSLVSAGVHDLSEEDCISVADETKSVFEFTFTNLRAQTKVRQDFVSKVKKWAGGKGKQSVSPDVTG
jgi:hypothetical protein